MIWSYYSHIAPLASSLQRSILHQHNVSTLHEECAGADYAQHQKLRHQHRRERQRHGEDSQMTLTISSLLPRFDPHAFYKRDSTQVWTPCKITTEVPSYWIECSAKIRYVQLTLWDRSNERCLMAHCWRGRDWVWKEKPENAESCTNMCVWASGPVVLKKKILWIIVR